MRALPISGRLAAALLFGILGCTTPSGDGAAAAGAGQRRAAEPKRAQPPALAGTANTGANTSARASEAASSSRPFLPVALVDEQALDVAGLLGLWVHRDSRRAFEMLEHLIGRELIRAEAGSLGLRVSAERVDERFAEERRRLAQEAQRQAPGSSLDDFIWNAFGLDPVRYLDRIRSDVGWQLTAERVVRAWTLASERTRCRLIVVASEQDAAAVEAGLANGEDFAALARRHSIDDSAEDGGQIPAIVRSDETPLARLAFSTPLGEVAGPFEESGTSFFLRIEGRPEPQVGPWSKVGADVLASLEAEPVAEQEFLQWKLAMEREHAIDRSGFLELVGELAR